MILMRTSSPPMTMSTHQDQNRHFLLPSQRETSDYNITLLLLHHLFPPYCLKPYHLTIGLHIRQVASNQQQQQKSLYWLMSIYQTNSKHHLFFSTITVTCKQQIRLLKKRYSQHSIKLIACVCVSVCFRCLLAYF